MDRDLRVPAAGVAMEFNVAEDRILDNSSGRYEFLIIWPYLCSIQGFCRVSSVANDGCKVRMNILESDGSVC